MKKFIIAFVIILYVYFFGFWYTLSEHNLIAAAVIAAVMICAIFGFPFLIAGAITVATGFRWTEKERKEKYHL